MDSKLSRKEMQIEETYEAIRIATQEIIEEKGVDKLTIREICERVGISVGTFYNYFSSKDDLILHRYKAIDVYYMDTVKPLLSNNDEWLNLCLFAEYYSLFAENAMTLEFSRKSMQARLSIERDAALNKDRPYFMILNDIFKRGQDKGIFRKDLEHTEMSDMTIILLKGYLFEYLTRSEKTYFINAVKKYFPIWSQCFLVEK